MKQIKIENNGIEQLITVPENSKVTIDGNVLVFEPKFKKGDIVYYKVYNPEYGCTIAILNDDGNCIYGVNKKRSKAFFDVSRIKPCRFATDQEKQLLFDALAKEGKQWNAEKLCIEDLKVVPKVGDYFKSSSNTIAKCCELDNGGNPKCTTVFISDGKLNTFYSNITCFKHSNTFKILTENEYAKEYAQLGFEYNFENDTISEIKWKPKDGEIYWHITVEFEPARQSNDNVSYDLTRINALNCFKTKELCQQAIDKIKQVLS